MDFTFSPEQDSLREVVRSAVARRVGAGYGRQMLEDERGFTDEWWAEVTELGWPGLLLPEEAGGAGLGLIDAAVVQEELGRAVLPGPMFSSAVAASVAAVRLGEGDIQKDLASGRRRGTVAIEEAGHGSPLSTIRATATPSPGATHSPGATPSPGAAASPGATPSGSDHGWRLHGLKPVVVDGHTADFAIVAARTDDGLAAFVLDDPGGEPVPCLDLTRKVARVDIEGRSARRIGPPGDQTELLARVCDDVAVALCAETVGAAGRALDLAVDYAKQRVQFGRPIATFQAIRHKIVDMLHQLELARVGTHWAAWASQVDDPMRSEAAAACKAFVPEAAVMITGESIQVHGGVGFTWDLDCHLLFRRVKQNDVLFGNQSWSRARLADLVLDGSRPETPET